MLAHLVSLLLASSVADSSAQAECGIQNLDACQNMNQLVWDDGFDDALRRFVGTRPANWLYDDGTEIGQVFDVLGGPPDEKVVLPSGLLRFSACRHRSCDEKGAVFLTPDGDLRAIAVLHFNCGDECLENYVLTVLVPEMDKLLVRQAEEWATEVLDRHDAEFPDYFRPRWETVDILLRP